MVVLDIGPQCGARYTGNVLREFWAASSTSYKAMVFSAMGLIAAGIALSLLGSGSQNQGLMLASLPVIGLGLVVHATGVVIRGRQVRRMIPRK